jgi:hypothetical protein
MHEQHEKGWAYPMSLLAMLKKGNISGSIFLEMGNDPSLCIKMMHAAFFIITLLQSIY